MSVFLGVDLGTTHVKAALFSEDGALLRMAVTENGTDTVCAAGACNTAENLWERAAKVIREVCAQGERPLAVGVTGMADSGVALDARGEALCPIAPWSNPCGEEYGAALQRSFPDLTERTGQRYHPKFAVSRLLWLREHEPERFSRMACWLSVTDWLLYRLTGETVTDETFACRTMLYRFRERRWDEELCAYAGAAGKLPRVVPIGGMAGRVTEQAARELGIPAGIPVVSAGHDHLCALLALERAGFGGVLNSLGTAEVFVGSADAPAPGEDCRRLGVNQGCFADGRYYWMANLPASGGSVEWLRRILSQGAPVGYDFFDKLPDDPGGVVYLPYLSGSGTPDPDPARRGAFFGLSSGTTASHLAAAVNRGIAFETRRILESLSGLPGSPVKAVAAAGGGARNRPLVRAKANACGIPFHVCPQSELTALGAAFLAAGAAGCAMRLPLSGGEVFFPQPVPSMEADYMKYSALCALLFGKDGNQ